MRQVFITGASSDIGIETSKKYLENGFRVLGHYNRGQSRFFELVDTSENMDSIQIDFSNSVATEQTLELNEDLLRKTDVLINMAAISQPKPFFNITALDIMDTMNVNLITSILVMRSVIPGMIKRKWGRIVNIGSIGVKFGGGKSNFCYSLSKHSLEFFPADHKEWAAKNVFVNTLRIGVTDTRIHDNYLEKKMADRVDMIPAKRMAKPEEIAGAIYWFGSDQNTFTTGQVIGVSGGE